MKLLNRVALGISAVSITVIIACLEDPVSPTTRTLDSCSNPSTETCKSTADGIYEVFRKSDSSFVYEGFLLDVGGELKHNWDETDQHGNKVPSGTYIIRLSICNDGVPESRCETVEVE
jgi:flagellar hook assembly protein FlgD